MLFSLNLGLEFRLQAARLDRLKPGLQAVRGCMVFA